MESEVASAFAFENGSVRVLLNLRNASGFDARLIEMNLAGQVLNTSVLSLGGNGDDRGKKIIYQSTSEGYILGELDFQNDNTLISLQKISF